MKTTIRALLALIAIVATAGCMPKAYVRGAVDAPPRTHVILIDGTANDETTNTNVLQLRDIVERDAPDARLFYVEGPGAKRKVIGMATGWGVGYRVRMAYAHLLRNYHEGDRVYLFGFSRGAYSARILASLLHHAGLPANIPEKDVDKVADMAYAAFKGDKSSPTRRADIEAALAAKGIPAAPSVPVNFMGLWDTVGAMGLPHDEELFDDPNRNYGDQLCNVQFAAHALALDDDRAKNFTPVLLTKNYLLEQCAKDSTWDGSPAAIADRLDRVVEEVWFSGAHADVGGGYDGGLLKGVSLNWMLGHLVKDGLLQRELTMDACPTDPIHYPSRQFRGRLYEKRYRNLAAYAAGSSYNGGNLKVHQSVIGRLARMGYVRSQQPDADSTLKASPSNLVGRFPFCFKEGTGSTYRLDPGPACRLTVATSPVTVTFTTAAEATGPVVATASSSAAKGPEDTKCPAGIVDAAASPGTSDGSVSPGSGGGSR